MIKTNKNIDYGASLTRLLEGLKFAEEMAKSNEEYKYPNAYGRATMSIKMHLIECTDLTLDEIHKATTHEVIPTLERHINNPDDIPENLYLQYGQPIGEDGILSAPVNVIHNPSNIHP